MQLYDKNKTKISVKNSLIEQMLINLYDVDDLQIAIENTIFKGKTFKTIYTFDRIIGLNGAIEAKEISMKETANFAKRKGRKIYSRVENTPKVECKTMVLIGKKVKEQDTVSYLLLAAYVGTLAEKESAQIGIQGLELEKCLNFWSRNALIWDENNFGEIEIKTFDEILEVKY